MGKSNKVIKIHAEGSPTIDINKELTKLEISVKGFELVSVSVVPIYDYDPQYHSLDIKHYDVFIAYRFDKEEDYEQPCRN